MIWIVFNYCYNNESDCVEIDQDVSKESGRKNNVEIRNIAIKVNSLVRRCRDRAIGDVMVIIACDFVSMRNESMLFGDKIHKCLIFEKLFEHLNDKNMTVIQMCSQFDINTRAVWEMIWTKLQSENPGS